MLGACDVLVCPRGAEGMGVAVLEAEGLRAGGHSPSAVGRGSWEDVVSTERADDRAARGPRSWQRRSRCCSSNREARKRLGRRRQGSRGAGLPPTQMVADTTTDQRRAGQGIRPGAPAGLFALRSAGVVVADLERRLLHLRDDGARDALLSLSPDQEQSNGYCLLQDPEPRGIDAQRVVGRVERRESAASTSGEGAVHSGRAAAIPPSSSLSSFLLPFAVTLSFLHFFPFSFFFLPSSPPFLSFFPFFSSRRNVPCEPDVVLR